jgi:hypothetical protein
MQLPAATYVAQGRRFGVGLASQAGYCLSALGNFDPDRKAQNIGIMERSTARRSLD